MNIKMNYELVKHFVEIASRIESKEHDIESLFNTEDLNLIEYIILNAEQIIRSTNNADIILGYSLDKRTSIVYKSILNSLDYNLETRKGSALMRHLIRDKGYPLGKYSLEHINEANYAALYYDEMFEMMPLFAFITKMCSIEVPMIPNSIFENQGELSKILFHELYKISYPLLYKLYIQDKIGRHFTNVNMKYTPYSRYLFKEYLVYGARIQMKKYINKYRNGKITKNDPLTLKLGNKKVEYDVLYYFDRSVKDTSESNVYINEGTSNVNINEDTSNSGGSIKDTSVDIFDTSVDIKSLIRDSPSMKDKKIECIDDIHEYMKSDDNKPPIFYRYLLKDKNKCNETKLNFIRHNVKEDTNSSIYGILRYDIDISDKVIFLPDIKDKFNLMLRILNSALE
ncbi:hypothetical protein D3C87_887570 [compost metagenome]